MNKKAFSQIIGVLILMVIIVILSSFILALPLKPPEKPPYVAYVEGKVLNSYHGGSDDQVVLLIHKGGDPVDVRRLTLYVEIVRENRVIAWFKLWNFPWKDKKTLKNSGVKYLDDDGDTENYSDSKKIIIDTRSPSQQPWLGELSDRYGDGVWSAGEHIGFRIKKTGSNPPKQGGVNLQYGDIVRIKLMYDGKVVILEKDIVVSSDVR